jgi:uncharacterized protein
MTPVGSVAQIWRYPVKSMQGEVLQRAPVTATGLIGDRALAFIDEATNLVASAKYPAKWRHLLAHAARTDAAEKIWVSMPDGRELPAHDELATVVTAMTGRPVSLVSTKPNAAAVERAVPEDVVEAGVTADVDFTRLELGMANPLGSFVDYAPLHLLTTSTLAAISEAAGHTISATRFRPNLVLDTGSGGGFVENDWVGCELQVGTVRLRVVLPTPRCAIPTLAQGDLPQDPAPIQVLNQHNRVMVEGFGVLPSAGVYAEIITPGEVATGQEVSLMTTA